MADYKILQNIDLAQNEIKEVSKIANDRQDGKDKGLLIQTGNNTSLAFNRKIDTSKTINSIKGIVKDGTDEDKKESTLNLEPSKVIISNTKGTETSTNSTITIGLTTPDSEGKEHIEAVSPSIDIKTKTGKTEVTDYAHPYISLKKDGSTLELQSNIVKIRSKETTESSLTMNGGITGVSNDIHLKDSFENVSLHLNTDGTISESANTSITETVGTRSVLLNTEGIKIEDSTTSTNTPSIIKVNNDGIKASKTSTINNNDGSKDSYIDIQPNTIEEKSSNVTIKTPNKVTLTLNEDSNGSASLTSKGTITLTSQGDAETKYDNNIITTKADTITIKAKGYEGKGTEYYPHIELKSTKDTDPVNSILLEGKTIDISSKDKGSDTGDIITLNGSKLNVKSATTEITSNTINIKNNAGTKEVLTLKTSVPSISIPLDTEMDINSTTIGLGESDSNSTTTVKGSKFEVYTNETLIENDTTISGTTTIQSIDSDTANTIEVNGTSTSITGNQADINPAKVNIGTVDTSEVIIGKDNTDNTTTLKSSTTEITSPTLNITSPKVDFKGTNQEVIFEGASEGEGNSSVTSKVPTVAEDTTVSVKKGTNDVFKVDTTSDNTSTTINGTTATINPATVEIGITTTNAIIIGRNVKGTSTPTTTLQSSTTKITSPTIEIGKESPSTSVSIGKDSSDVTLTGRSNFSVTATTTNSKVQANDIKFNTSLSSNDIKIRWDSTLNSLVFEKA